MYRLLINNPPSLDGHPLQAWGGSVNQESTNPVGDRVGHGGICRRSALRAVRSPRQTWSRYDEQLLCGMSLCRSVCVDVARTCNKNGTSHHTKPSDARLTSKCNCFRPAQQTPATPIALDRHRRRSGNAKPKNCQEQPTTAAKQESTNGADDMPQ